MNEFIVENVTYIAQKSYQTCWLAAYKMMLEWKKKPQHLAENLPNHQVMRQKGLMDTQFKICRDALGLLSTIHTGFRDPEAIEHKLRSYGPIWVSGFFADGHKHCVVLSGVRGSGNNAKVLINDPLDGMKDILRPKADWWPIGLFVHRLNPVAYACQHWWE